MKKSLWTVIMGIMLLLVACQNDDDYQTLTTAQPEKTGSSHFYGVKSVTGQTELRGVAQRDKLWNPGTVITVKLLNDPYDMADKIKTYAAEWEKYANIKFDFVTSGNANVRIGFDWNDSRWVTWSYTGTDCKFIRNQNEATVNFALWDAANEATKRADVLRAFGQVLGLDLEHRHLSFDAGWTSRIADYWESEIEDIPWDELKEYVFDPIEERNLVQTNEYDENSIMIWPFSRKYANNTARECNYELSAMDIAFIGQLYPREQEQGQLALTLRYHADPGWGQSVNLELYQWGSYRIEYADGTSVTCEGDSISIFESNDMENPYAPIKIYGDPENIKKIIEPWGFYFEILDMSACKNLTEFKGELGTFETYDFSIHPKLEYLYVKAPLKNVAVEGLANLKSLKCYISGSADRFTISNPNLENLVFEKDGLVSLDVSNLPNLKNLDVSGSIWANYNSKMEDIDLSANELLESFTISCYGSPENINLMNNSNLKKLILDISTLKNLDLSNCIQLNYISLGNLYQIFDDITKATAFANSLPTVTNGTISLPRGKGENIRSISESKGWTVNN